MVGGSFDAPRFSLSQETSQVRYPGFHLLAIAIGIAIDPFPVCLDTFLNEVASSSRPLVDMDGGHGRNGSLGVPTVTNSRDLSDADRDNLYDLFDSDRSR